MSVKLSPDLFDVKKHNYSGRLGFLSSTSCYASKIPCILQQITFILFPPVIPLSPNPASTVALKQVKDGLTGRKILDHHLFSDLIA